MLYNQFMTLIWIKFFACTIIIFYSGRKLAEYGDILSEKTGLGGLWVGLIFMSAATSLPELFTGAGSILLVRSPDLAVGNILGANRYNLLSMAVLDFFSRGRPFLSVLSRGQFLAAGFSVIPVCLILLGLFAPGGSIFNVGIYSILILVLYFVFTRIVFRFEKGQKIRYPAPAEKYGYITLQKTFVLYGISSFVIICAGLWLASIGDDLAQTAGMGRYFIGSMFLGFATTLPELTVSVSAMHIGAVEMATANLLGSNLFNANIILVDDILYRKASIYTALSRGHILTALSVIAMTIVLLAGFARRKHRKTILGISIYSVLVIIIFIAGIIFGAGGV